MKKILAILLVTLGVQPLVWAAPPGTTQQGIASYYHDSLHGNKTASGQRYDRNRLSAAHKTLPLGSQVRVTNLDTGEKIVVKVNDRGPFIRGRIIDLSRQAARQLDMIEDGLARVKIEVLSVPQHNL